MMEIIHWLNFIKIVLQAVKRLKKIVIKKIVIKKKRLKKIVKKLHVSNRVILIVM